MPGHGPVIIETLGRGDVIGWSWLFPPFEWLLGGVTMQPTQAFELDGRAVRAMCEADPVARARTDPPLITVVVRRLQATRIRLLDVYGRPEAQHDDIDGANSVTGSAAVTRRRATR